MCIARFTPRIALLLSALTAVLASAAEEPNIIVLFADDLVGICAHEPALKGGEVVRLPEFTLQANPKVSEVAQ